VGGNELYSCGGLVNNLKRKNQTRGSEKKKYRYKLINNRV
jgi:hypothetical protein